MIPNILLIKHYIHYRFNIVLTNSSQDIISNLIRYNKICKVGDTHRDSIGMLYGHHNLYSLFFFQSREVDRTKRGQIREANFYFFLEAAIALFVSFLINLFVVSVFAEGFYNKTNAELVSNIHFTSCVYPFHFTLDVKAVDKIHKLITLWRRRIWSACSI